jgi:hypothetical protein
MKLADLNRPCLCRGPGMIPNPQLHIAAAGRNASPHRIAEWSRTNSEVECVSADDEGQNGNSRLRS